VFLCVSQHYQKVHLCFTPLSQCTLLFHIIINSNTCVSHHYRYVHMCFTAVFQTIIIMHTSVLHHYQYKHLCFTSLSLRTHVFHSCVSENYHNATCVSHHYHDAHLSFTSLLQCMPMFQIIIIRHARKLCIYNIIHIVYYILYITHINVSPQIINLQVYIYRLLCDFRFAGASLLIQ
jgi:hypothetical protein